jgi:hypothetical protein
MGSDYDSELVKRAILHIKSGEIETARRFLERALDAADDQGTRSEASFWLSEITVDRHIKRQLLETVLAYDMQHAQARRALAILDGKLKPDEIVDADKLKPQAAEEPRAAHADRFTCPKCGARMVFAPDGRTLFCEHCSRQEQLNIAKQGDLDERDFFVAMATGEGQRKPVAMHTFICKGCGAQFVLAPEVISATCSYCGSPHVIDLNESCELIEPDGVIPLALTQQVAAQKFAEWCKTHKVSFNPADYVPRPIYLPVWTFDVGGTLGYIVTIVIKQGRQRVYKTVAGNSPVFYNDIPVPASRKKSVLLARALHGYDFKGVVAYDPRYLADIPAQIYDISMADASLEARSIANQQQKSAIPAQFSEEVAEVKTSTPRISVESFKLVLVPAWIVNIDIDDRTTDVLINGQSGGVQDDAPANPALKSFLNGLFGR